MKLRKTGVLRFLTLFVCLTLGGFSYGENTIHFDDGNPSFDLNGPSLEITPGTIGIGEVGVYVSGGTNLTGIATCWPSGAECDPGGEPVSPASAASAIDHYWLQGDPPITWEFSEPLNEVVAVSGIDHGPLPGEALEFIIFGVAEYGYAVEEGAIKAVYADGVDPSTDGPIIGGPGSTGGNGLQITAGESDDLSSVWLFEGSYTKFRVMAGDHLAGFSSPGEYEIDGLAAPDDGTVPATNCASQGEEEEDPIFDIANLEEEEPPGCDITGGQNLLLPEEIEIPASATVSQEVLTFSDDAERCGQEPLFVDIPDTDNDLFIPDFLCGPPEFVVLVTTSEGLDFNDGTVEVTNEPGAFFSDPSPCDQPIPPGDDPQLQDVMVWQTTVASDLAEGRALELTFECGSSRGRTRSLSYFVIGMRIDFGLDFAADPVAVRQAFIDLTETKLDALLDAVLDARPVLPFVEWRSIRRSAIFATILFDLGLYDMASSEVTSIINQLPSLAFDTTGAFNNRGNIEMRAFNARFMIDEKIIGIAE